MAQAANPPEMAVLSWLRRARRGVVKQSGKRLIRALADFMSNQSLVEDAPILRADDFDWARTLEDNWRSIRAELDAALAYQAAIPSFHEISPDQENISKGDKWKTFVLFGFGYKVTSNCRLCPETTRLLAGVPGLRTAFFSILAPGYHIPAHRGVTKGVLRAHLGLIVPEDRENCWMRVGDRREAWSEGRCVVFDDTYEHEVRNNTDERRVVLLIDVDRPMRRWGRAVHGAFMTCIRWSAYVQDARKNLKSNEAKLAAAVAKADALRLDAEDKESSKR